MLYTYKPEVKTFYDFSRLDYNVVLDIKDLDPDSNPNYKYNGEILRRHISRLAFKFENDI